MYRKIKTAFCIVCMCLSMQLINAQSCVIDLVHTVGKQPLVLDTMEYQNSLGQPFTLQRFKYYFGNITLTAQSGKTYHIDNYFLVDEADAASKRIELKKVPKEVFTQISFLIGVDSIHNCSGVQTGALDPMNGMFWTWNTGYIFVKLEGRSAFSALPAHKIEYHIGGFKQPNNAIRKVTLPLQSKSSTIRLQADIATMLNGKTRVDFIKLPSVTDAKNATLIADNYMHMFSVMKE